MPDARVVIRELLQTIASLESLIIQFADGASCHYDHDELCQTHALHERPCPYGIANSMAGEIVDLNDQ